MNFLPDAIPAPVAVTLRVLPTVVLLWLAWFFGRTLRASETPLIERVARVAKPALSPALVRYTRLLTALWCAYFVVGAALNLAADPGFSRVGLGVAAISTLLFVVEHGLRRFFFPGECFPNPIEQVRDTVRIWRPRSDA